MAKKNPKQADKKPTIAQPFAPGIQLPAGVAMQQLAPPLPPDLTVALDRARRSGRFFITIATADEDGNLQVDSHRSDKFHPDWLLRGWQMTGQHIVDGSLTGVPVVRQPAAPVGPAGGQ